MQKDLSSLKWYAGILTLLLIVTAIFAFTHSEITHFKEISAERINIIEKNGMLRMVLSNKIRSPEVLAYSKSLIPPNPGGTRPGLFFNDEGTENGGLVFMGIKDSNGRYSATGHLSFDQYNQNQVL